MNCSIHLDGKKQCTYVEDDNLIKVRVFLQYIISKNQQFFGGWMQKLIALLERKDKKEEDEDSEETKQALKDLRVDVK